MRKGKRVLTTFFAVFFVLLCATLVACGKDKPKDEEPTKTTSGDDVGDDSNEKNECTITYKNGETVLKTVNVEKGSTTTAWDPSAEVTDEFFGWYAEPTLKHTYDFSTAITEDKTIFGSFVGYQKDERHWAIAGSGVCSVLSESNWGKVFSDRHYMSNESTSTKNIFKMTINLFKDDQFQFTSPVFDGDKVSWGHQRGGGYLVEPTKNEVEYFIVGGGLGGDNYTANITCAKDGKYEFVLTTYPKGDFQKDNTTNTYDNRSFFDTITYTYLGECEETRAEVETTFYIKGKEITGWGDYVNNNTIMVPNSDKTQYTLANIFLAKDDEFMFATKNKDVATGKVTDGTVYLRGVNLTEEGKTLFSGEGNMKVLEDGYYTFVYDLATNKLDAKKVEYTPKAGAYYIDGSFCSWGGAGNDTYVLKASEENPYVYELEGTITLAVDDEVGVQYYDKDGNSYNGYFSAANLVANSNFDVSKTNAKALVAGTYKVQFNSYTHLLTLTLVTE